MKVGFVCGAWDLLHVGHLHLLREANRKCDYLIVGLQVDPSVDRKKKNKPVQSMYERYVQLVSTRWVSEVIPYESEEDLLNLLKTRTIDIRFLGSDYESTPERITGRDIIPIEFIPRNHTYSSSELRERIKNAK